jgi:hypothetical protein
MKGLAESHGIGFRERQPLDADGPGQEHGGLDGTDPTPRLRAAARCVPPRAHFRQRISRARCIGSRSVAIPPPLKETARPTLARHSAQAIPHLEDTSLTVMPNPDDHVDRSW